MSRKQLVTRANAKPRDYRPLNLRREVRRKYDLAAYVLDLKLYEVAERAIDSLIQSDPKLREQSSSAA